MRVDNSSKFQIRRSKFICHLVHETFSMDMTKDEFLLYFFNLIIATLILSVVLMALGIILISWYYICLTTRTLLFKSLLKLDFLRIFLCDFCLVHIERMITTTGMFISIMVEMVKAINVR
uniref:Uncharacterized protein n=1 Tax=Opuntia streptacantha TaxID=393608 RepID=A0A7C8ZUQ2_OPUST